MRYFDRSQGESRRLHIRHPDRWKFDIGQPERLGACIRHAGAVVAAMMIATPTRPFDQNDLRCRALGWHGRTGKSLGFKRKHRDRYAASQNGSYSWHSSYFPHPSISTRDLH
jgi:hypothetical protein